MLNLLERAFQSKFRTSAWQAKIRKIIPGYGMQLSSNPGKARESLKTTSEILQLGLPPDRAATEPDMPEARAACSNTNTGAHARSRHVELAH